MKSQCLIAQAQRPLDHAATLVAQVPSLTEMLRVLITFLMLDFYQFDDKIYKMATDD